jgi:hypothetical protein
MRLRACREPLDLLREITPRSRAEDEMWAGMLAFSQLLESQSEVEYTGAVLRA